MSYLSEPRSDLHTENERLAKAFATAGRYNPHFLGVTAVGFFAIYVLTLLGIFGEPATQLIFVGLITGVLAAVQFPLLALARREKGITANLLSTLAIGIFAVLLTCFWKGIVPLSILIVLITPAIALRARFPLRYVPLLALIVALSVTGIVYVERVSAFDRLQNNSPAAVASFAFLAAAALLLITIASVSESRNFKSLQTLLLTSFIFIVTIPTIMATALSAVGNFATSESQTFSTLKAITSLKESQLRTLVGDFQNDMNKLQSDQGFSVNALSVLTESQKEPALLENSKRVVRDRVTTTIGMEEEHYSEVMVLDSRGRVVISTIQANEGLNLASQVFFRQGTLKFYVGFADLPAFGQDNLIIAAPIYDIDGRTNRGVAILRSDAHAIKALMGTTPGFENAETYLVDKSYRPVTQTRAPVVTVTTRASQDAISNNVDNQQGVYDNYAGQKVLGNYKWLDTMQVAIIAEVPLSFIISSSLRSLVGSAILALFVIAIAVAAVSISARSIAYPIISLAQITENFAAGKLTSRAPVNRKDEIGALAKAYNEMASQLQETIAGLENRVNERTGDLETQTLRLRAAAEIARDSASERDLSRLLERSAQLIQSRFGFYHTGIFLLDNSKEYAVLVASPTEAGKQMIANTHRLRVGEVGIVGRVAATGEPRITLDTDADGAYFNNPYLPTTRSEMALPLKAKEQIIGVLDIQSEEPNAFNDDDVAILQTMADQLATAIERTRLLEEVEQSLKELESAYGTYTRENWKRVSETGRPENKGYRFDNIRMEPVSELTEAARTAFETGRTINSNGHSSDRQAIVAVPVKLRGQTIGVIHLKLKENYGDDTISTIELASERLATALESARLYEEARLRADREQSIAQVTSAISASTNYEEILQTTVREIGSTLKDADVIIQITAELKDGKQNG